MDERKLIFGFPEEWTDFGERNATFLERFENLKSALDLAFNRKVSLAEPIDKFVLLLGRVCAEDFFELFLCCGNGAGQAAQKLLRGLFERAVTLRYLEEHPAEIDDYADFYWVSQRKLIKVINQTLGPGLLPPDTERNVEENYQRVKDRFTVTACEACSTKRANYTWSKLDFVSMAATSDLGKSIVPGYYVPMRQTHATVASIMSRIKTSDDEGLCFIDEAQRKEADQALRTAHFVLLDVLKVQSRHFKTDNLEQQIDTCMQDFIDIWKSSDAAAPEN